MRALSKYWALRWPPWGIVVALGTGVGEVGSPDPGARHGLIGNDLVGAFPRLLEVLVGRFQVAVAAERLWGGNADKHQHGQQEERNLQAIAAKKAIHGESLRWEYTGGISIDAPAIEWQTLP
jgi:hypothetical protein